MYTARVVATGTTVVDAMLASRPRPMTYGVGGNKSERKKDKMLKIVVGAVIAAGVGLGVAAPAQADPMNVQCAPCVQPEQVTAATTTGAPWTDFFANAPWEKVFDPAGNGQGVWEKGVQAVNGGAWEKVFPPAP